jgi:phosphopantothenoylcysteine decarboxylase/phosphopantothenate--cysteine ligase
MFDAVMEELPNATVFIGAAAVADYAPVNAADSKIKKEGKDTLTLELKKTPDILSEVSKRRKDGQLVIGFAAETNEVRAYAAQKLAAKGIDLMVANDVSQGGIGFDADDNEVLLLDRWGGAVDLPKMSKLDVAGAILDRVLALRACSSAAVATAPAGSPPGSERTGGAGARGGTPSA